MRHISYGHQYIDSSDIKEVVKVLKSYWLTQGPKIKEFEDGLCEYSGAKYAVVVSSGTAALHIACLAAGIKRGDKVITSPVTFLASVNCVLYCGATPVFADVKSDTININPEEIKKKINKKTKAIIPIHFAGHPCELEEIQKIAKKYKLIVIEDAAHALGAKYKNTKIGSCKYSDMAIFSFHPVKSITTGEGGAVLTNNKSLYEKLLKFRNHGITKNKKQFISHKSSSCGNGEWYYEMQALGFNYRITDLQCALGISQLKKINKFIEKRREIVALYNKNFSQLQEIELPVEKDDIQSAWHLYVIRLKGKAKIKRNKIFNSLRKKGIGVQVHYMPIYLQPYYQSLGYGKERCLVAEDYYQRAITLPLYPNMQKKYVTFVTNALISALR